MSHVGEKTEMPSCRRIQLKLARCGDREMREMGNRNGKEVLENDRI